MSAIVIDTNVLLVANGSAPQMSGACRVECIKRLEKARSSEAVVLDRQFLVLGEYQHCLDPRKGSPGPGDAFVRHLLQNMANAVCVAQVDLTPTNPEKTDFLEFPDDDELRGAFYPSDRKFVAASNAHPETPPIVESADSKWLDWEDRPATHGIHMEVLCRQELDVIRARKTKLT